MASCRSSSTGRPRDAIGSLCHLMNLKGISGLTPEVFRQAKFNKPEAVTPLSSLLSTLTHFLTHKCIPSMPTEISHQATPSNTMSAAKHVLWAEGYRCQRFHCLPDDMSHGGRELLLACGWLLAKTDILMNLMMDDRARTDTTHLHIEDVLRMRRHKEQLGRAKITSVDRERRGNCGVKYLTWLVGRCRMAMRRLYVQQQELSNLTHQIHIATHGASMTLDSPHLSPLETYILRHTGQIKKYQQMLEAEQNRLYICVKWQEQQATFWQWMESVLDANLQDSSDETDLPGDCGSPESRAGNLVDLLRELESHTQQLEHLLRDVLADSDMDEESNLGINFKQLSITEDIKAKLAPIPSAPTHHSPSRGDHYQTSRFHLIKKYPKPVSGHTTHIKPSDSIHIQEEIVRLSAIVDGLQLELDDLRRGHCSRMDDLASVLPDAVCIPPLGSAR